MSRTSGRSGRGKKGGMIRNPLLVLDAEKDAKQIIQYELGQSDGAIGFANGKYSMEEILNRTIQNLIRSNKQEAVAYVQKIIEEYSSNPEYKVQTPAARQKLAKAMGFAVGGKKPRGGMMPGSISGNPKEGPTREVLNPIPRRVLDPSAPRRVLDASAPRRIFVPESEPVPTVLETVKDCLKCKKSNSGKGKDDDDKYALFQKIEKQLADLINKQQNEKDYDQIDALITNLKSEAESFLARPGAKEEHKMYIRFVLHTAIPGLLTRLAKIPKQASGKYKKCHKCGKFKV
jgi:hypothetical protein